jgi:hypothetical protein
MKDIGKAEDFDDLVKNFTNIEFPYWPNDLPYLNRAEKIFCVVNGRIKFCETIKDVQYLIRLHESHLEDLLWYKGYRKR